MTREPLAITVEVNGVPVRAELPGPAVEALRRALVGDAPAPAPAPASPFLTPDEAAEVLRCGKRRIYDLVHDGRLTRHGDGRRLLVRREEVLRLASGEVTSC